MAAAKATEANQALTAATERAKALEGELSAAQAKVAKLLDEHQLRQAQDQVPNLEQQIATLRGQLAQQQGAEAEARKKFTETQAAVAASAQEVQAASKKAASLPCSSLMVA